jgi:hypothetical protein
MRVVMAYLLQVINNNQLYDLSQNGLENIKKKLDRKYY